MLDDDERRARPLGHARDRVAHLAHALGVEVGRRLVEQDEPRAHREHARQREALLLPTREGGRRPIERHIQTHRIERLAHPLPDLVTGDAEVLGAERHVVPDAREDRLAVGVLQHEPGPTGGASRGLAVDRQLAA